MNDAERNARFDQARNLYRPDMPEDELNNLRIFAGTMRPITKHLGSGRTKWSRFLWWLFDVEYTR